MTDQEINSDTNQLQRKWGQEILRSGFVLVPTLLLRKQGELDLESSDLAVLLNLLASWWKPEEHPFPKTSTLAKRMGVTTRTVQRSLKRLESQGFIKREKGQVQENQVTRILYDLSGTVRLLRKQPKQDAG